MSSLHESLRAWFSRPRRGRAEGLEAILKQARSMERPLSPELADWPTVVALYQRVVEEGRVCRAESDSTCNECYEQALIALADILETGGPGVPQNGARAVRLYEEAIRECHSFKARNDLALLLERGCPGVDADPVRAKELYEWCMSESSGDQRLDAMCNLAVLLQTGALGVAKDESHAQIIYNEVLEAWDDCRLENNLALPVQDPDPEYADALFTETLKKRERGDVMNNFALLLQRRENTSCLERAVSLYYRAIEQHGNVHAMVNLANLYRFGVDSYPYGLAGDLRNARKAAELYEVAIEEAEDVDALAGLARLVRTGDVSYPNRDVERAINLMDRACRKGGPRLSVHLTTLARFLLAEDAGRLRDPPRAKALLEEAVRVEPNALALHELAVLMRKGDDGVEPDADGAMVLFKKAKGQRVKEGGAYMGASLSTIVDAGSDLDGTLLKTLREAKTRPRQCFVMVLGGPGRGKTCTVASLRGMSFESMHLSTRCADLSRLFVVPGQRQLSDEELEELFFRYETFPAVISRTRRLIRPKRLDPLPCHTGDFTQAGGFPERTAIIRSFGKTSRIASVMQFASSRPDTSQSLGAAGVLGDGVRTTEFRGRIGKLSCIWRPSSWSASRATGILERARMAISENPILVDEEGSLVQCWDLGGEREYVMAHALFVRFVNVAIFVIDLEKLAKISTRDAEVRELCKWIQLAYSLASDPGLVIPIIVGTRKATCGDSDALLKTLKRLLLYELGRAAYDGWIRRRTESEGNYRLQCVAMENSIAQNDAQGSGLEELETAVHEAARSIVNHRPEIPARWVAFVDHLEETSSISNAGFRTRADVEATLKGFPGFSEDRQNREHDGLDALKFFRGTGRLTLFQVSKTEYYVFMNPEKLVDFVRQVTGPEDLAIERLGKNHAVMLSKGLLTQEGLAVLWPRITDEVRGVMLGLLCEVDLLLRLKQSNSSSDLIGIPALLPEGWDGFKWNLKAGQYEVTVITKFVDVLPPSLAGSLIPHLHRTVGEERTSVEELCANAVILSVDHRSRVAVVFKRARRQIWWTVRSEKPLEISQKCLKTLEEFLNGPLRGMEVEREHVLVSDCLESKQGCGGRQTVRFTLPTEWVSGSSSCELSADLRGNCVDGQPWELCELLPKMTKVGTVDSGQQSVVMEDASVPYDVFISHAGSEKHSIAYPIRKALEGRGLRCFLDEESLKVSSRTNGEQILAALRGSRCAIFVLSAEFAARKWPMLELTEFQKRHEECRKKDEERPVLFPLFYGLDVVEDCGDVNLPNRESLRGLFEERGFFRHERQLKLSTAQAMQALKELSRFIGLRNDRNETGEEFAGRAARELGKVLLGTATAGESEGAVEEG